jgi:hypothetical protein
MTVTVVQFGAGAWDWCVLNDRGWCWHLGSFKSACWCAALLSRPRPLTNLTGIFVPSRKGTRA